MITTIYPEKYLASNNDININIKSDENRDDHKVILNLVDDESIPFITSVVQLSNVTISGNLYTKFYIGNPLYQNKFKTDDIIYLYGQTYNIIEAGVNYFIIDDILYTDVPSTSGIFISKSLRQFKAPFVNGNIDFNLREYTSNLVKSNFEITNNPYSGSINNKALRAIFQESYKVEWEFTDNQFDSGKVGFIGVNVPPFQIGDKIIVEQEFQEWSFTSVVNDNNKVKLIGTETVEYQIDQSVTIIQNQETYLNGTYSILEIGINHIIIDCTFKPIPVGNGFAYSNARPTYDGVATIVDIQGNLIITDKGFTDNSRPIGGKISLYNKNVLTTSTIQSYPFHIYQAQLNLDNQLMGQNNDLIDYIIFDSTIPQREIKWSTVMLQGSYEDTSALDYGKYNKGFKGYKADYVYPINRDAISSINILENVNSAVYVETYDANKQWLGEFEFALNNNNSTLIPISIESLSANATVSINIDDVKYYNTFIIDQTVDRRLTRSLSFEIIDECKYDAVDLLFRDSMGSLIPIPFYKLSRKFIESDKKYFNTGKVTGMISKGDIVYNSRSKSKYILNTDWVEEHISYLIEDLIKSNETYLHNHKGELFRVNITNTSQEVKKMINDKLIQYTIEVESSHTNKHK